MCLNGYILAYTYHHTFSLSDSHTILVFLTKPYSDIRRGLHNGGVEVGYEKIAIFDKYRALSRKRYKIGPQLLWNANKNSIEWRHFQ